MAIYDIVMLIVLIGAIWFGYWKGLAWQIASLAAVVISYIVAVKFRDPVAGFIQTGPPWNTIISMLILFLGTSLLIWTVYASIAKSLKKNELKGFDRQAGALLGAVKGVLLCMVITMFAVSLLGEKVHESIDHSRLGPYVEKGIWQVSAFVPAELAKYVDPHIESYKAASQHGEPILNPAEDIKKLLGGGGSTYQVNQPNGQIPPGNQNYQGYQGTWQTTPTSQPNTNQQFGNNTQFGTNHGVQTNSGSTQTAQNQFNEMQITEVSKQILEQLRQQGTQMTWEAIRAEAQRRLETATQR